MHAYTFPHKNEWSPYWPVEVRQDQRWMFLMTGRMPCTLIGGQNWWQLSHILFNFSYIPPASQARINGSLHIFCLSFLPSHPSLLHPKLKIYHYSTQHVKQVSSPPGLHSSVWKQLSMTDTSQNTQVHSITPFSCTFTSLLPDLYRHCLTSSKKYVFVNLLKISCMLQVKQNSAV